MMLPYRLMVGGIRMLSPVLSRGDSKMARGFVGRRHAHDMLAAWGSTMRDPGRPTAWFHAPSVGEGLQAEAVIAALRGRLSDLQVVFTFFSPSAEGLGRRIDAEVATYLPWDLRGPTRTALDAVRPDVLIFTKTEVWPTLASEAGDRGVPVGIVGATVPEGAGRMNWPARSLLGPTWRALRLACANSAADAERLVVLGVTEDAIRVTGDPGIDSAATRFDGRDPEAPYLTPFSSPRRPTLVAGSSWPSDEAVLLPAMHSVREVVPDVRMVVAPHEPDAEHLVPLVRSLEEGGWRTVTLSEVERSGSTVGADAVVVDRVGVLAALYGTADVAFVGGGFHDAGLHSVLEPAAACRPVVFGPRHQNARAAGDLVARGGAKIAADQDALARIVVRWLQNEAERKRTGRSSGEYIEEHRGTAIRSADHVASLIEARA